MTFERVLNQLKSLLTEEEKEVCHRYKHCEDCPEFEKYYYDGICYYVYFREMKDKERDKYDKSKN